MILLAETPVKYRDGTVKTLDELGGEAKELAPDTPVVSGGSSKPLDEFIQDQIVLSPDTVLVDEEETTTLEDFIEDVIESETDSTPTENSTNLVSSGGVYDAVKILSNFHLWSDVPYMTYGDSVDLTGCTRFFFAYSTGFGPDQPPMIGIAYRATKNATTWYWRDVNHGSDQSFPTNFANRLVFDNNGNSVKAYTYISSTDLFSGFIIKLN